MYVEASRRAPFLNRFKQNTVENSSHYKYIKCNHNFLNVWQFIKQKSTSKRLVYVILVIYILIIV